MRKTGTANVRAHRKRDRHSATSFVRVRDSICVELEADDRTASKPKSEICSTSSREVIRVLSMRTTHCDVANATDTAKTPGTFSSPLSMLEVQLEQVMP